MALAGWQLGLALRPREAELHHVAPHEGEQHAHQNREGRCRGHKGGEAGEGLSTMHNPTPQHEHVGITRGCLEPTGAQYVPSPRLEVVVELVGAGYKRELGQVLPGTPAAHATTAGIVE